MRASAGNTGAKSECMIKKVKELTQRTLKFTLLSKVGECLVLTVMPLSGVMECDLAFRLQ